MKQWLVIYTAEAAADLDWIYDSIALARDPVTASRFEQRIRDFCNGFEYGAEWGALRDSLRPGLRVSSFERRVTIAIGPTKFFPPYRAPSMSMEIDKFTLKINHDRSR